MKDNQKSSSKKNDDKQKKTSFKSQSQLFIIQISLLSTRSAEQITQAYNII